MNPVPRSTDHQHAFAELRDGVRAVVSRFDARYWQRIDEARAFPQEFVQALTEAGWLSALIPEQYGGADLSLTEASFRLLDSQTIAYDQVGEIAERSGNQSYYSAPANVFKSKDGKYLALAGSTDAIFRSNARAIGRADVIEDERFSSNVKRLAQQHTTCIQR